MKTYIEFVLQEKFSNRKTFVWDVLSKGRDSEWDGYLGRIKWYSPWRQYCFFPAKFSIWNVDCLKLIIEFIDQQMKERKK